MMTILRNVTVLVLCWSCLVNADPCTDVRNAEFVCIDKRTLGFCVQTADGWRGEPFLTCENNFVCDKELRSCRVPTQCPTYSAQRKFSCQNEGRFPHPYNCQYYFDCDQNRQETCNKCPSGYSYSAKVGRCMQATTACQQPLFDCNNEFEISAWPDNDNIFFVCKSVLDNPSELEPILFKCSNGKVFNGVSCVSKSTSKDIPKAGDNSSTAPPSMSCSDTALRADPNNCLGYMVCNHGTYTTFTCPSTTKFDSERQMCVVGTC